MSPPVQPPGTIHVRRGTDQYGNTVWFFGDHAIRVDESGPKPWFVLKDCFAANGVQWRGSSKSERVKDQLGLRSFRTPRGVQSLAVITESGFYTLAMRGHRPISEEFRRWLAEVAIQIRNTGTYSVEGPVTPEIPPAAAIPAAPQTAIQLLQQQAAMALQVITELAQQERRVANVEARVEQIEQTARDATKQLLSLPAPTVPAPERTDRHNIVEHIRGYCLMTKTEFQAAFAKLYREVLYRLHLDVAARRRHDPSRYSSNLDVVEKEGKLAETYALNCELFQWEPRIAE